MEKQATLDRHARKGMVLFALCLAALIINIDVTIVNVALPTLVRELGATTTSLQWVVDAYTLVFAALILAAGSLSDRVGRKGVLLLGLAVFGASSLAGAFATTPVSMLSSVFNTRAARATLAATGERCDVLLDRLQLTPYREWRAAELSYGGQRRLGVAIALAASPELLMLDEPVAGLNPEEAAEFGRLIREVHETEGVAVLLVEHHMRLVMGLCHRIVVLDHGELIAEGVPLEIRANRKVIEAYLGSEEVG